MVAVLGAGLSGLTAAKVLADQGIHFHLFEKAGDIGGRVRTDQKEGFLLDHGFQVLLDSYPQVRKHLCSKSLDLKGFPAGAEIYLSEGRCHVMMDPFREPLGIGDTLFGPIGTFEDKFKALQLRWHHKTGNESAFEFLQNFGFSKGFIDQFLRPFFAGIFLNLELDVPASYLTFLYQMFAKGCASLPRGGMQAVPDFLAQSFRKKVHLNYSVKGVREYGSSVTLDFDSGGSESFDRVILALDAPALGKLIPEFNVSKKKRSVSTLYFSCSEKPKSSAFLLLNGSGKGKVNHIAFLSNVQPSYAPKDKHLIAVNVIGSETPDPTLILDEIRQWSLCSTEGWQHIDTYSIKYAQPAKFSMGKKNYNSKRLFVAGDFTQTPSIEGAMCSGELAATELINQALQ
jgi:protoporphyrinogen oxidase